MKNMKIKVETDELGESNLDEIVATLESKGWSKREGAYFADESGSYLIATDYGIITWCAECLVDVLWSTHETTTLAELRSMNIETLKEI